MKDHYIPPQPSARELAQQRASREERFVEAAESIAASLERIANPPIVIDGPIQPDTVCVCGDPTAPGLLHRTNGPCHAPQDVPTETAVDLEVKANAPSPAPTFTVGQRVRVKFNGRVGLIVGPNADGWGVHFPTGMRRWFTADELEPLTEETA
jgi:hypothetical protein